MTDWDPSALYDSYKYAGNLPKRGLLIDGLPALGQFEPARVARYVLLTVRDPLCAYDDDPATQLARRMDRAEQIGRSGMFTTWTGEYKGVPITAVSGGSGSPEAELILHELLEFTEADTFVRVGGSGGIHPKIEPGDVVISSGVVRDEGMTRAYIPASYPAISSYEVVVAMSRAATALAQPFHVGITRSSDSDFVGVGRPGVGGYFQPWHLDVFDTWARAGVLNGDRESAAVVTLSALFGRRGGSVCSVADNVVANKRFHAGAGHHSSMDIALEGIVELAAMDRETTARGETRWLG